MIGKQVSGAYEYVILAVWVAGCGFESVGRDIPERKAAR